MLGKMHDSPCYHCGRPIRHGYMVHDDVWLQAFRGDERVQRGITGAPWCVNLHAGCLQQRIGRPLTTRDIYYGAESALRRFKRKATPA